MITDHAELIARLLEAREADAKLWDEAMHAIWPEDTRPLRSDDWLLFRLRCLTFGWLDAALMLIPPGWDVRLRVLPNGSGWCSADTGTVASKTYAQANVQSAAVCAVALKIDDAVKANTPPR